MINHRGQHPGVDLQQDKVLALSKRVCDLVHVVNLPVERIIQGVHHQAEMVMVRETNLTALHQIETERVTGDDQKADHQLGLVSQSVHILVVYHHNKETTLQAITKVADLTPKACHLQGTRQLKVIECQVLVVLIQ